MFGKRTAFARYATGYTTLLLSAIDDIGRPIEFWVEHKCVGRLESNNAN